ncbi:hypothetical protein AVEN_219629-1 [Araneus ventricosus]|uniref:Uncharacterized protein n=1 Tax=Araneus ventricosus TaxID=182803 RepID=A0A4Y2P843_ARAVE|nr:hypothetical protein AVEN_219629-1 [Araneus ventricosus]
MSPLTLKKSRAKDPSSKVSLDRRRQEGMVLWDALIPHALRRPNKLCYRLRSNTSGDRNKSTVPCRLCHGKANGAPDCSAYNHGMEDPPLL